MLGLIGGGLIGVAATLLLLFNGRILGITGIVAGLPTRDGAWRALFVAGMILGAIPAMRLVPGLMNVGVAISTPALVAGGLLVGFGTRMANGCTSGHGVCGVARLAPRSIASTLLFIGAGALTVFAARHLS
jgi:uncharacterized membrane protein YedE/YeeE